MDKKQIWIIGIGGSDIGNVNTYRVRGTKEEVKAHLFNRVVRDRRNAFAASCYDEWDFGTESASEVEENHFQIDGLLYAYASYETFHIDYTAIPEADPSELSESGEIVES